MKAYLAVLKVMSRIAVLLWRCNEDVVLESARRRYHASRQGRIHKAAMTRSTRSYDQARTAPLFRTTSRATSGARFARTVPIQELPSKETEVW
jgi:hypothetical protein